MTDPDLTAAVELLTEAFDAQGVTLLRAKCPGCGKWRLRSRYALTVRCDYCRDLGEAFTLWDLLLMVEFRLSWKAYQAKLDTDGPPWANPRAWTHSRARQTEWQRRYGTGRQRPEQD